MHGTSDSKPFGCSMKRTAYHATGANLLLLLSSMCLIAMLLASYPVQYRVHL